MSEHDLIRREDALQWVAAWGREYREAYREIANLPAVVNDRLAKAVEALRGCMHCHDCTCGECNHIRSTLAEIEGEKG
jgi:hypothetical protein